MIFDNSDALEPGSVAFFEIKTSMQFWREKERASTIPHSHETLDEIFISE